MRRLAQLLFCVALIALCMRAGDASAGPDPAKLKAASESFEAGARAYGDNRFAEAAPHFEAADAAAPSAKALRLAIKARVSAGQYDRAASLSALALERYPADTETKTLATDTIAKLAPTLHRLDISCVSPCLLASGTRIVHGEAATRWTIYVSPGKTTVGASFVGNITAPDRSVTAAAGGSSTIRFAPPKDDPDGGGGGGGAGAAGAGGGAGGAGAGPDLGPPPDDGKSSWRIHPAFFFVGLALTAGAGGTTIWSGIDTINDPGADRVREECAGQGEACQLYQDGQAKEVRTNALIGATAGLAAITVILGAVSDWGGSDTEPDSAADTTRIDLPRLWVDVRDANPSRYTSASSGGLPSLRPIRAPQPQQDVSVHISLGGRFQ